MEAKIFTTNEYGEFIGDSFFAGTTLSGVTTAKKDTSFINKGFIGCGVAITGASCYNLSKMDKEKRHELLEYLYTPKGL
ncbi:MAG: hypothetical protein IJD37_05360, partial [Clostridia bacterium]|nr:hypothetical protein [Clostridia bacterium]